MKGQNARKHGLCYSKIYRLWARIKTRCLNKSEPAYKDYGGRGIKMDSRWVDNFVSFYNDISPIYVDGYTIERIDVNGDYILSNITFIPKPQQSINRRSTVFIEIDGVRKPMKYWCADYGIKLGTVSQRIKNGWNHIEALTTPPLRLRRKIKE